MLNNVDNIKKKILLLNFIFQSTKAFIKNKNNIIDIICQEHKNYDIRYFVLNIEFKELTTIGRIERTTAIYYRILIQNLLPQQNILFILISIP